MLQNGDTQSIALFFTIAGHEFVIHIRENGAINQQKEKSQKLPISSSFLSFSPNKMTSTYPPKVSSKELQDTVLVAIDWALAHGLIVRPTLDKQSTNNAAVVHAPFALYPTPFPRKEFEKARNVQQPWNTLIHKMSQDDQLISETMET